MLNNEIKFLELKDANELINLYSLVDRNILLQTLEKNMVKYINDYFQSFVKSFNEVLEYISEKDYNLYMENENVLENYLIEYDRWNKKSIIDKNEKLFIVDVFNHKIYKLPITFFGKLDYYFTDNNHLKLHYLYQKHSTTSREDKPCILEEIMYCYIFDLNTNNFINGMEIKKHSRFYGDNSWNSVLNFVKNNHKNL